MTNRSPNHDVTTWLQQWADEGNREALDHLMPLVYDELRQLAASFLRRERAGHTLQATALAHEAFLKLVDQDRVSWKGRTHFLAVSALAMRRLLVDHAERHHAKKRGGGWQRVTFDFQLGQPLPEASLEEVIALDAALERLGELNPRHARVLELRVFAGMSLPEVASHLDVSLRTVERDWAVSRAWLRGELAEGTSARGKRPQ